MIKRDAQTNISRQRDRTDQRKQPNWHPAVRFKGNSIYLPWSRRRAVVRLARRIREDSIWIRQACLTQPNRLSAFVALRRARCRLIFSAQALSTHQSNYFRNKCQSAPGMFAIDAAKADWATAHAGCGQIAPRLCCAPCQGLRPLPSARVASRHRSGPQRGSREVYRGALGTPTLNRIGLFGACPCNYMSSPRNRPFRPALDPEFRPES